MNKFLCSVALLSIGCGSEPNSGNTPQADPVSPSPTIDDNAGFQERFDLCADQRTKPDWKTDPNCQVTPRVLYVTIDPQADLGGGQTHEPNLRGLDAVTGPRGLLVERIWAGDQLGRLQKVLTERKPLAIVFSGSFTEWYQVRDYPLWGKILQEIGVFLKQTKLPILAICGSHQLVGSVFGGWNAVGHVNGPSIADELAVEKKGYHLIPDPRIGEVGTFPLRILPEQAGDPIFSGIPSTFDITQSHFDEVRYTDTLKEKFVALAEPMTNAPAIELASLVIPAAQRSVLPAMRWRGSERVFYSVLFHPDLIPIHPSFFDATTESGLRAKAEERGTAGAAFLGNFFDIALRYWQTTVVVNP